MPEKHIVTRSWDDLANTVLTDDQKAQLAALEAMSDEEIQRRVADDPDAAPFDPALWVDAELVSLKIPVSIRLDAEIVAYFKAGGPGYQSRINSVLANYVRAKQREQKPA
ncbi:hypothetical protein GCM10011497_24550 [Elstera cyanobacteriorum]|nr:BrnA antitoxin family protein [Elstera cyanobacteriorum]GFZ93536.1 hypothetical protein GCM10011497_24550 [Elstera cyanobacteriorum]